MLCESDIESSSSAHLRELITNMTFVGCVDEDKTLVQHGTKLYMFNSKKFRILCLYMKSHLLDLMIRHQNGKKKMDEKTMLA
ncbi:hypothetical protein O3M35_008513 [Rhynocoris fuscipes]|uniref:DNA mismatch repair protein Mlh1 C-terminal domain-containing protein n=1 Tax=Rhynocoris fuscipes TaxID=488301 RepID=A0AAW1D6H6_9HEMI